jgi:signal transduction histidine kinase
MTEIELRSEKAMRSQVEANLEAMVKVHTQKYEHIINNMMEIDRLKSLFLDRISMELHVPVTNLNLYLKLLEDGRPEKKEHYMMVLKKQSEKLFELVQAIVAHSQMKPEEFEERYLYMNQNTIG